MDREMEAPWQGGTRRCAVRGAWWRGHCLTFDESQSDSILDDARTRGAMQRAMAEKGYSTGIRATKLPIEVSSLRNVREHYAQRGNGPSVRQHASVSVSDLGILLFLSVHSFLIGWLLEYSVTLV